MKFFKTFLTFLFVASLVSSCATARSGGAFGSEHASISNSNTNNLAGSNATLKSSNSASTSLSTSVTGFYIGIGVSGVDISDNLTFRPELNFIALKNLNQLQLPVLVGYEIIDKLTAVGGPSVAFLLNQGDGIKSLNYGFDLGAGYEFIDDLSGEIRYNLGVANLSESDFVKLRLSTLQVGLSYRF